MPAQLLLLGNHHKRRHSRHRRRDAAGHFLANPGRSHRRRRVHRNPESRSTRRRAARMGWRHRRHYRRNPSMRRHGVRAMELVKAGLWGGAGAISVDLIMGTVGQMLPASFSQPNDPTTGSANFGYYATKGALALGLAMFGSKFLPSRVAAEMGAGAVTVVAYQVMRGLVPAGTLPLGAWFNPAPIFGTRAQIPGAAAPRMSGVRIPLKGNVQPLHGVRIPVGFRKPNQ
jgi:hypothetical protein